MSKLADLKQTYDEWNKPSTAEKDEFYPTLYLEGQSLDAMGIETVRAGSKLKMIATVRVCSVSDNANGARSMSFEIIEAAMTPEGSEKDAAKILFPNG
ncbi:hypothetical protein [Rhizobium laguerreae]|uniref:hypothetical protein n=1 Tax=Rhizobium laguerreae TaxID=1076926 RepID=UPI001C90BBB9|nr:hypothetical protein [Rhizobium laguerreae]MBY3038931.1 hypothetical protein [Rhizobium laguerreae]